MLDSWKYKNACRWQMELGRLQPKYAWELIILHLCTAPVSGNLTTFTSPPFFIYPWVVRFIPVSLRLILGDYTSRGSIHEACNLLALRLISKVTSCCCELQLNCWRFHGGSTEQRAPLSLNTYTHKTETQNCMEILREYLVQILSFKTETRGLNNVSNFTKLLSGWASRQINGCHLKACVI